MINVSTEFKELMGERTDFRCWAEVTLADGRELKLGANDFAMGGQTVTDGAGAQGLPLGAAVCRTVELRLANQEGKLDGYEFYGARLRLYLTFALSETEERVELGTFTVTEPESRGETVTVTAADDMYRTDRAYTTALAYPATLGAMFRELCDGCGIPYATAAFPNSGFSVASAPGEGYTCRQVLGHIAMLAGGNARVHRDGRMEILSYDPAGEPVHELKDWIALSADTDDVVVTGLEAADGEGNRVLEGSEGYVLAVEDPLMAGQEAAALAAMGARLIGLKVRRFQGEYIAYPLAECMDRARIVDRKGNAFTTVLTDVAFTFGGRTALSNSAEAAARNASRYATPETKVLQAARQLVAAERTVREAAVAALNDRLARASGMYGTQQVQPDGSSIWYLHDKPELAQSSAVMKLTSDAIGFSTDGGKSYPFGFTVTGEMVMGVIRSEGISADWVKVGGQGLGAVLEGFVGRDENDQIVSMLNASADQINIRGNRFTLDSDNFKVAADGSVTAKNGKFAGTVNADAFTLQGASMEVKEDYGTLYRGDDDGQEPGGVVAPDKMLVITSDVGVKIDRLFSPTANIKDIGCNSGSFSKLMATHFGAYEISENKTPLKYKYLGIMGKAASATKADEADFAREAFKLMWARNINGVPFDGKGDITVYDNTKLPLSGGTLTGDLWVANGLAGLFYAPGTGGRLCLVPSPGFGIRDWNIDGYEGVLRIFAARTDGSFFFPFFISEAATSVNNTLVVGNKVSMRADGEGGNIDITPPDGFPNYWEIDAYDGNLRAVNFDPNVPGSVSTPLILNRNPAESVFYGKLMGGLNAVSDGVWRVGDRHTCTAQMPLSGIVSSSAQSILIWFPTGKPIAIGTHPVIEVLRGTLRGPNGYIDNNSSQIEFVSDPNYTVSTVQDPDLGMIRITIRKNTPFTNVSNNVPVNLLTTELTFRFDQYTGDEPLPGPEIFADDAGMEVPSMEDGVDPTEKEAETV